MAELDTIDFKEYKFRSGDLLVVATYGENEYVKNISYKCADSGINIAVFNLRTLHKQELKEKVKDNESINDRLYIDEVEKPSIEYIANKCFELSTQYLNFCVWIDLEDITIYNENDIKELKKICSDLHLLITIAPDIKITDTSPNLSDLKNKALEDTADVVVVGTDKQSILVKNKYGKTGILNFEEDKNNE